MNKKQKDNLIKALEELNAPDKDVLLQKIESKKALGGDFAEKGKGVERMSARKKRVAWTSFACSVVVVLLAVLIISISVFGGNRPQRPNPDSNAVGADKINYRYDWKFEYDDYISFGDTEKNIKDFGVNLIYDYKDGWTIVSTQVTQDESAYREYYVNDSVSVEVTVLLDEKVTSMDGRYYAILSGRADSINYHNKYVVYNSSYSINGASKQAYVIYLEKQVYIFTSDVDLRYLFV